jgi:hypothetical protein
MRLINAILPKISEKINFLIYVKSAINLILWHRQM